ncbi:MAG: ABC transporter, partial [Acidimicrobiia bacterium]|nr:ABC transporter [Acidimicrobiia bacterium]
MTETVHNSLSSLDATESGLRRLSQTLADAPLVYDLEGAEAARNIATELGDQINDYLIPRMRRLDAPLLAVLGGSTGSGKSTITNTLAGAVVSKSGVIRPTTRAPTLICHPEDARWFMTTSEGGVLAGLPRVTGEGDPSGHVLKVTEVGTMTPGLAIVDAPDIDSVALENRDLATQLLASADLWLFTTTAVRYADAVPWDFLRRARNRGTSLAIIINRIPVGAASEVVPHLAEMMAKEGFGDITVFPIEETDLTPQGLLPELSVSEIRDQLDALAESAEERAIVIRQTLDGALRSVPNRARIAHRAVLNQDNAVAELKSAVDHHYGSARDALYDALTGGTLLRNEVLDRWQELIGVSELLTRLQSFLGRLRDRVTSLVTGRVPDTATVQGEITNTLEQLLIDLADDAALHAVATWRQLPGGRQTLADDTDLERSSV